LIPDYFPLYSHPPSFFEPMAAPVLFIKESDLKRGPTLHAHTMAMAEKCREPLNNYLDLLQSDRSRLTELIENHYESAVAPICLENVALLALSAKNPDKVDSLGLISKAGMALRALFELEWMSLDPEAVKQLAEQIVGYTHVIYADAHDEMPDLKTFANLMTTSLQLELAHHNKKSVYRDPYLLIAPEYVLPGVTPELYLAVPHRTWHVWNFFPASGINRMPPVSSFKAARRAIASWHGPKLKGDLCGSDSARICKMLGMKVNQFTAEIHPVSRGFA
jgi:hypothetical protein